MFGSIEKSVFLVTSTNASNSHFGTAFCASCIDSVAYVVTAAHVIRDVGGADSVLVGNYTARVLASGSPDGSDDLAVLQLETDIVPLPLSDSLRPGEAIGAIGFQQFAGQFLLRPISGRLKSRVALQSRSHADRTNAWDVQITDEYLLQPGFSGAPVLAQRSGCVVGVLSHRLGTGTAGIAISIGTLRSISPELAERILGTPPPRIDTPAEQQNGVEGEESWASRRSATPVMCPMCGETAYRAKSYFIHWNDERREFEVKLSYECWPCHYRFDEEQIKTLPLAIARDSVCACGGALILSDHSIRRTGEEIELEATYSCGTCSSVRRSLAARLVSFIHQLWMSGTKVIVGPTGVQVLAENGDD